MKSPAFFVKTRRCAPDKSCGRRRQNGVWYNALKTDSTPGSGPKALEVIIPYSSKVAIGFRKKFFSPEKSRPPPENAGSGRADALLRVFLFVGFFHLPGLPEPVQGVVLTGGGQVGEGFQQPPVEHAAGLGCGRRFLPALLHEFPEGNALRQPVLVQPCLQGRFGFLGLFPHLCGS